MCAKRNVYEQHKCLHLPISLSSEPSNFALHFVLSVIASVTNFLSALLLRTYPASASTSSSYLLFILLCFVVASLSLYICVRACVSVCVFIDISVFYISGYFWSITQIPVNEVSLRVSLHHPAICSNWTHRLTHKKRYIEHGRLTSTYASLLCLRFDSGAEENGILWVVHREHVAEVLYDGVTARCNTKRMNIVCGM